MNNKKVIPALIVSLCSSPSFACIEEPSQKLNEEIASEIVSRVYGECSDSDLMMDYFHQYVSKNIKYKYDTDFTDGVFYITPNFDQAEKLAKLAAFSIEHGGGINCEVKINETKKLSTNLIMVKSSERIVDSSLIGDGEVVTKTNSETLFGLEDGQIKILEYKADVIYE